ncbi:MAG: hypothetical protein AAGJ35_01750 [Myxococcota bacterium]
MKMLVRYFFAPIAWVRPLLLWRGVLILLAFDVWLLNISHAGRYGVAGFNVSHFGWMEWLPLPSAGLYTGVCALTGIIALWMAFRGRGRLGVFVVCVLYTYSWAMSMLDSYQHHVLLSWVLFCMVFFPEGSLKLFTVRDQKQTDGCVFGVFPEDGERVERTDGQWWGPAWGFVLMCLVFTVVYGFTALNKSEAGWSATLRALMGRSERVESLRQMFFSGMTQDAFWQWMMLASVLGQLLIGVAYAWRAVPGLLEKPSRVWRISSAVILSVGCLSALGFHLAVETEMSMDIGWFSYYMLWATGVCFFPVVVLEGLARTLYKIRIPWKIPAWPLMLRLLLTAFLAYACVAFLDLPGAHLLAIMVSLSFVLFGGVQFVRGREVCVFPMAASVVLFWASITFPAVRFDSACLSGKSMNKNERCLKFSSVRYDLYRFWGGDLKRRGKLKRALHMYRKAQRYVPPGVRGRAHVIRRLERRLQQ